MDIELSKLVIEKTSSELKEMAKELNINFPSNMPKTQLAELVYKKQRNIIDNVYEIKDDSLYFGDHKIPNKMVIETEQDFWHHPQGMYGKSTLIIPSKTAVTYIGVEDNKIVLKVSKGTYKVPVDCLNK